MLVLNPCKLTANASIQTTKVDLNFLISLNLAEVRHTIFVYLEFHKINTKTILIIQIDYYSLFLEQDKAISAFEHLRNFTQVHHWFFLNSI